MKLIDLDGANAGFPRCGLIELPSSAGVIENVNAFFEFGSNPASEAVNIVAPAFSKVRISDITGQVLKIESLPVDGSRKKMNLGILPAGCYLLTVVGKQGSITRKLIKM